MQRLADHVLQAPQLQREGQEKGRRQGAGGAEEAGGTGDSRRDGPQGEASFAFSAADSPHSPSPFSAQASYFGRTTGPSGVSGSEGPRGRSRGPSQVTTETPNWLPTHIRSRTGSRALDSPSWTPTAETVPSQLVGGRFGTDANVLVTRASTGSVASGNALKRTVANPVRLMLSPSWTTWQRTESVPARAAPRTPSPNEDQGAPTLRHSSSSFQSTSSSSMKSNASSFAYLLHDRRNNMRLFKKKSKPPRSLSQQPSLNLQQPEPPKHTASFYKPKIVEDSRTESKESVPLLPARVSPPREPRRVQSRSPARSPVRKLRATESDSDSLSLLSSPLTITPQRRVPNHSLLPTTSEDSSRKPGNRNLQIEMPPQLRSHMGIISVNRPSTTSRPHHLQTNSGPSSLLKRRWPYETPPEREPRTPFERPEAHDDHYFRIFGPETFYQHKASLPKPSNPSESEASEKGDNTSSTDVIQVRPPFTTAVSDTAIAIGKKHKRSSIAKVLRIRPRSDSSVETPISQGTDHSSRSRGTPDITISSAPAVSRGKHTPSPASKLLASYFPPALHRKKSSELTTSSTVSSLSTHWEDVVAESQPRAHVREISEALSPLSLPQRPVRPKPSREDARLDVPQAERPLPKDVVAPVVPSGPLKGPQQKYKDVDGKEYYKTSLTGPGALNYLPSEMKRVDTPPLKESPDKKVKGFKGFFFDMRSMPSDHSTLNSESPADPATKRRLAILPRSPLKPILSKLSLRKLKSRTSKRGVEGPEQSPDPYEVTNFQQTPYSQRQGDARRAEIRQIRAYMDETLQDDDDDGLHFSFELDVPEHLPNSPLCPLNPLHKDGGKSICPIHRRRKTGFGAQPSPNWEPVLKAAKTAPRIVYESGEGDGRDYYHECSASGDHGWHAS